MAQRITNTQLNAKAERLNRMADTPLEPYTNVDGKQIQNPGNFHIDYAYGGAKLVRMVEGGGCENTLSTGYNTKRELAMQLDAIIVGYALAKAGR